MANYQVMVARDSGIKNISGHTIHAFRKWDELTPNEQSQILGWLMGDGAMWLIRSSKWRKTPCKISLKTRWVSFFEGSVAQCKDYIDIIDKFGKNRERHTICGEPCCFDFYLRAHESIRCVG